jgi:hypothetical protein
VRIKFPATAFILAVTIFSSRADTTNIPPFAMNGWQFHDYNIPKLEEAVNRAPDYGVNFFIFSHEFFRSVEGFLASTDDADPTNPPAWVKDLHTPEYFRIIPHWQSDLRHIGDLATAKGIPYYLWVHEFDDVPNRFLKDRPPGIQDPGLGGPVQTNCVDMENPELWKYLDARYERLLAAVPNCAGFVLTLHESDFKVFYNGDVISKDDVPTRIHKVTMVIYNVLKRHHKQLILRNFFYEPQEMKFFKEALDGLPDDIIVMSKDTTHEFQPFYPWDPLHGETGKKRQIMEVDLGVEKAWSTQGAYAQTDYLRRVALRAREKGLAGLVGRARLSWDKPFEDSHEVNLYAFSRFLQNPDLTTDEVLNDWATRRYPSNAISYIVSALKRTEFINHHGRWPLGYWLTKGIGDAWDNYLYYFSRVVIRSRYKWTHDPADKDLEEKLYHPDEATFKKLVAEKDEVIAQVRASQNDLHQSARYLTPEQLAPLEEDFRFLLDAAQLQREWIRAYFAQRMFMDKPTEESRMIVENALNNLEQIEKTPGVTYGLNPATGRRYDIDKFELEMRWHMANRARALDEDARILEKAREVADVDTN